MSGQPFTFQADQGQLEAPMIIGKGSIYQPVETGLTNSGRASYRFTTTNSGSYELRALVNAPPGRQNSFWLNIDSEPADPAMLWEIAPTSGYQTRVVAWSRINQRASIAPARTVFALQAGSHELIIRGRSANTQIASIQIFRLPAPPGNLRALPANSLEPH